MNDQPLAMIPKTGADAWKPPIRESRPNHTLELAALSLENQMLKRSLDAAMSELRELRSKLK